MSRLTFRSARAVLPALLLAAGACSPAFTAASAHTGREWQSLWEGSTITTFRDNPPLSGLLAWEGSNIVRTPEGTPYSWTSHPRLASAFTWDRADYRFGGSGGATFRDDRNPEGVLGISHAGPLPTARTRLLQWHSNGLLLSPGVPVDLQLQRRSFVGAPYQGSWQWGDVPNVRGRVVLDQRTRLVGVTVIVVRDGTETMLTNRALAELWFDGRTVDRLHTATSSGGSLNAYLIDHDPRPNWRSEAVEDPAQGRTTGPFVQEVDAVWSYCGVNFGQNIQFRLVRYREITSSQLPGGRPISSMTESQIPYTIANALDVVNRLEGVPAGAPRTLPIVIVRNYGRRGVAQAWAQGIIFGEEAFSNIGARNPQTQMAHELGHVLGISSHLFNDGAPGVADPENLMSTGAPRLSAEQCQVAHTAASAYAVR